MRRVILLSGAPSRSAPSVGILDRPAAVSLAISPRPQTAPRPPGAVPAHDQRASTDMRRDFQRMMKECYSEMIEELTGRKVLAFLS